MNQVKYRNSYVVTKYLITYLSMSHVEQIALAMKVPQRLP